MIARPGLDGLTRRIESAGRAEDWVQLAILDSHVASTLATMGRRDTMTAVESAALMQLQLAHGASRERCRLATAQLDERLAGLRSQREGWIAYALNDRPAGIGSVAS